MALKRLVPPKGQREIDEEKREIGTLAGSASLAESIPWGPILLVVLALFLLTVFDESMRREVIGGPSGFCGDGVCNSNEDQISCPADCVLAPSVTATAFPTIATSTPPAKSYDLWNQSAPVGFTNIEATDVTSGSLSAPAPAWVAVPLTFDFPNDDMLGSLEDLHVNVVARLDAKEATFAKAEALAHSYSGGNGKPVVKYYEIDGADTVAVKAAYTGIKSGCKDCKLVVTLEGWGAAKVAGLASGCNGACFDAIGLREYDEANTSKTRYLGIGDDVSAVLKAFKDLRLEGKEVWISELGVYSGRFADSQFRLDDEQAQVLVRSVTYSLAKGASRVFLSYPAGCIGTQDPYYCNLAISGRPAQATIGLLSVALNDAKYSAQFDSSAAKKGFEFARPSGNVFIAWNDDFVQQYASTGFATSASMVRETDLVSGQTAVLNVTGGRVSIGLQANPILVEELHSRRGGQVGR